MLSFEHESCKLALSFVSLVVTILDNNKFDCVLDNPLFGFFITLDTASNTATASPFGMLISRICLDRNSAMLYSSSPTFHSKYNII